MIAAHVRTQVSANSPDDVSCRPKKPIGKTFGQAYIEADIHTIRFETEQLEHAGE